MAVWGHVPKCSVGANLVRNTFEGCHRRPGSLLGFDPIRGGKVYSQFYNGQPPTFDLTAQNQLLPFSARYHFRTQSNLHRICIWLILLGINRRTACCGATLFLTAQAHYNAEGSS
jgi:hypothetical protein